VEEKKKAEVVHELKVKQEKDKAHKQKGSNK